MLPTLYDKASQISYEEDFQLTQSEVRALMNLTDMEIVSTLMWLKDNGGSRQKLVKPPTPTLAWCEFKLESNNLRTRFYSFVLHLSYTNPVLENCLKKVLDKI